MRLTLRTLLAYIDGILEQEDAEEIGKKIEESEFATNLLHRTRDVTRRLRLAAPKLAQQGSGLDANTVAEYLDNTLHDDRVPDFEKVCLESDVHLAEVASCHQILTLVLGEPAEINPDARRRMYHLPELVAADAEPQVASAEPQTETGDGNGREGASASKKRRQKPTVPDYLREPRKKRRLWPLAAALVLALCCTALVLFARGQFERDSRLMGLLLGRPPAEEPADLPPSDLEAEPAPPVAGPIDEPPPLLPEGPSEETPSPPVAPLPLETQESPQPLSVPPATEPPLEVTPEKAPEPPADTQPVTAPQSPLVTPSGPQRMGRLMSDDQVLLKYRDDSNAWQRVLPQGILVSEEPLVALSGFRPEITLGAGVALQLLGGTRIELLAADEQGVAGLKVHFGRALVMPLADAGAQVRLVVGDHVGVMTFSEAESIAILDVSPVPTPGANPESEPALMAASLYARSGQILWDEGAESGPVAIEASARLVVNSHPAQTAAAVEKLPSWSELPPLSDPERWAASKVEKELQKEDRLPSLVLIELADPDQSNEEVSGLASRCLADVDRFDVMVAALNNSDLRLDWLESYAAYLRSAVARSPEAARAIRQAIEKQHPQDSDALYRMLWGYTNQDLEGGADKVLVEHLDHPALALRLLAFWNLKKITDYGLYYRPEQTAAKRQAAIMNWQERQADGKIRIKPATRPRLTPPASAMETSPDREPSIGEPQP